MKIATPRALALTLTAGVALAATQHTTATILFPASITGNAQTGSDVGDSDVFNLISGVGLSNASPADEAAALAATHLGIFAGPSTHWVTNAPNGPSAAYFPHPDGVDPMLTVDMGGVQTVGSGYLWGYTGSTFAAGGNTPSQAVFEFKVGGVSQGTEIIQIPTIPLANAIGDVPATLIGFGQAYSADTIEITFTAVHGTGAGTEFDEDPDNDNISGGDRVGLGEILFSDIVEPNNFTPGDADGDGDIDDTDLGLAISSFTGPAGSSLGLDGGDGDTDGDGDVDDTDLGVAISGFTGPLAAAVPEPTSLALLTLGGLLVARRRRG